MTNSIQGVTYKVGDLVTPDPDAGFPRATIGRGYKITDVPKGRNGVNYKAAPCDAEGNQIPGAGLRGPAWALLAWTPGTSGATVIEYIPNPPTGAVVFQTREGVTAYPMSQPLVVFGDVDATRVKVVPLGGTTDGRYHRVGSKHLRVVNAAHITIDEED